MRISVREPDFTARMSPAARRRYTSLRLRLEIRIASVIARVTGWTGIVPSEPPVLFEVVAI
jgi:hypothetical protein